MQCARCGSDNPEGTKFCGECGGSFQVHCPQCAFANLPAPKFCLQLAPLGTMRADYGIAE